MQFLHTDLGYRQRGDQVEVTLSSGANVRLMDSSNFQSYRNGRNHRYVGGRARRSPVRLTVPNSGHWHVAVDMQGLRGSTRTSVRVVPVATRRPLSAIRERSSLSDIADNIAEIRPPVADERMFDVFISHATEDKDAVVRVLAEELRDLGLEVWYDEFEMRIGDSLRRRIDHGIARSRFGVVVLSPSFFAKAWPQYELDGLVTLSISGKQILLPLWHNVSFDDVAAHSPSLADKLALRTADLEIDEIAQQIADVVRPAQTDVA